MAWKHVDTFTDIWTWQCQRAETGGWRLVGFWSNILLQGQFVVQCFDNFSLWCFRVITNSFYLVIYQNPICVKMGLPMSRHENRFINGRKGSGKIGKGEGGNMLLLNQMTWWHWIPLRWCWLHRYADQCFGIDRSPFPSWWWWWLRSSPRSSPRESAFSWDVGRITMRLIKSCYLSVHEFATFFPLKI